MSLLHGEVRPTCSANGQKVAIIGTLTLCDWLWDKGRFRAYFQIRVIDTTG